MKVNTTVKKVLVKPTKKTRKLVILYSNEGCNMCPSVNIKC